MEAAPPSYDEVVRLTHWNLIAPYLSPKDLCSALRVCRGWHRIFVGHLWGDPSLHFGAEDDEIYGMDVRLRLAYSY